MGNRQAINGGRVQLETEVRLVLVVVGAQRGQDQVREGAQHTVGVQGCDLFQRRVQSGEDLLLPEPALVLAERGIEAGLEQLD